MFQHRSIADPETEGRYTVKPYASEKVLSEDRGWRHKHITLRPDSDQPGFEPIEISVREGECSVMVVAEMLMVLAAEID